MDYNIDNKKGGSKPVYTKYPSTDYSSSEQEKLLIGYDLVPEEAWELLAPKTHIRYKKKDGKFCRGGFVHNIKRSEKKMIFLSTNLDGTGSKFPVTIEDIEEIWKKRTVEDVKIAMIGDDNHVDEMNRKINKLTVQVEILEVNIAKLIDTIGQLVNKVNRPSSSTPASTASKYPR